MRGLFTHVETGKKVLLDLSKYGSKQIVPLNLVLSIDLEDVLCSLLAEGCRELKVQAPSLLLEKIRLKEMLAFSNVCM